MAIMHGCDPSPGGGCGGAPGGGGGGGGAPTAAAGASTGAPPYLGFGRIVASEKEAPSMLVNMVWSG